MKQGLIVLFIFEIIGYAGVIWILGTWKKNGELTPNRFALFQAGYLSLFILTAVLAISTTPEVTLIGVLLAGFWWVIGFPLAKWVYRQFFINKQ